MADKPEQAAPAPRRRRQLGEMLVDNGVITPAQLSEALERQKKEKGTRIGRLLLDFGYCTEVQMCEVMAEQLQIPAYTRTDITAEWRFTTQLSAMVIGQNLLDVGEGLTAGNKEALVIEQMPGLFLSA